MTGWFRRLCAVAIICWIRSTIVFGEEETSVPEWWSNEEVLERIVNTALEASLIPPVLESSPLTALVGSAIRPNIGDRGDDFAAGGRESHHEAQQFVRRQDNQPSSAGGSQLFPPIIHEGYIKGYERSPLDPRPREPIEGPQGPPKFESHRLQQQQQQQQQQNQENIRKRQEEQQQQHQENLRLRQEEERRRQQQAQQEKLRQEQKQQEEQRKQQQIQQERFVQQQQKIQEEKLRQQQQELQRQQQVEEERLRYQQQLENERQQRFQKEQQQIQEEQRRRQQLEQQEVQKQTEEQKRQQQQHQNRFQSQHENNQRNSPVRDFATTDERHQNADTSLPLIKDNFQNQPGHSQKEQVSRTDGTTSVDLNAPKVPSLVPVPNESQEAPSPPAPAPVVAPSKDANRDAPKPDKKLETGEDAVFPPFPISVGDFAIRTEEPKKKDGTFVSISDKRDFVAPPLSEETFSEETIPYPSIDEVTELQREDFVTSSLVTSQPPARLPEKVVVEPLPSSFPTNRPNFVTSGQQDIAQVETSMIDQEPKQQNVPESKQSEFIIPDNALPPNQFPDIPVPVLPPLQRPESHPPLTFPVFPSVSQIQRPAEVQPVPFIDLSGKFDFPLIQSCSPTLWRDKNAIRGRSLKEIAHLVGAGNFFALTLSVESLLDQIVGNGPYTLFLPSNEALLRLPRILLDSWCRDDALMTSMLRNHVVKALLSLDDLRQTALLDSSSPGGVLHLRNNRNETFSVNGQRISVADIDGPGKGIIHVLDGFLYPTTNLNILQTLIECRRYDGFLRLLHAAQLTDILRTGGITVFVPSNAALSKLSQEELQYVHKDQSTLREFLLYHIVNGIYFSSDVKEGYYLPTYLDKRAIKVGTRTDGCYRRLQEANNSPFHRTDIPATNGVIHILNWVLKPSDLDSCENLCLP